MKLRLPHKFQAALMATLASVALTTLSSATAYAEEANTQTMHVYILTGQSNSQGAVKGNPASPDQLTTYASDAIMWNGNFTSYSPVAQVTTTDWSPVEPQLPVYEGNRCMGPEYGFSYMMERFADNGTISGVDQLGILKASLNGGGNGYWVKDTATYNAILSTVETALTKAVANGYTNITIDGLLYLQGESNGGGTTNAGEMYKTFKQNLNDDLAAWLNQQDASVKDAITISFVDNSVLGQPSKSPGDTDASQQAAAGTNTDNNHIGYLYTSDMTGSMRYSDNLHFGGSAQLVIGARYAYAFAVQNGANVGAVRSSNKDQYLDNAMAWWMEKLPETTDVVKWDLSSVSISGGNRIQNSLSVGGIKVEDPYNSNSANASTVYITGGSLNIGSSGIELEKGGLSVASAVNTTADQSWKIAAGKALEIGSASAAVALGGAHTISIGEQSVGAGAGSVKIYAASDAGHDFNLSDGATLAVNASSTVWNQADVTVMNTATFGTIANGTLNINSLSLASGADFNFGGNVGVQLSVNTLTLGGDATFRMNVNSSSVRDMLTIGNVSAGSSPYTITFDLTQGAAVRSGVDYVLVNGWDPSLMTAAVSGEAAGSPTLKVVDNQLVVTFAGGESSDYTKPWVAPTGNPMEINAATFDATAKGGFTGGTASTITVGNSVASGNVYFYASDSNYTGDVYAELQDASVTWVAAYGSGSGGNVKTLEGSASVKVGQSADSTPRTVSNVYGAVNAHVSEDVYVELDAANYTYGAVNGAYNSQVAGNLTTVIKGGTVTGQTAGGFGNNNSANNVVSGDVRLQIDGGTFTGNVIGGSNGASSVIEGDIHLNLNGGEFKNYVLGGGFAGTYRGDIYVTISGGDFGSSKGIYAGFGTSSGITAPDAHTTVTLFAIDDTNTFAQYTGVLSGGNQAGSAALATRTLDLKGYTAGEVKANLTSFTHVNVLEGTETTIKKSSGASDLGGATSLQVDGSSTLTLNADAAWDASAVTTLTVEEGGILRKIGANNLTLGNISGTGTLAVAEGNATVGTFADATVDVASGSTLTVNNPGTTKVGTLSGAGNVLLSGQINGNTNFVCAEGQWTGSVTITGNNISSAKQELHFNNFGTKGSTVVIDGIGHGVTTSLYLPNGEDSAIIPNIRLTGNGLTLTDGSSNGNAYFKGNWSGNGGFTFSKAGVTQFFTFLGDMHEYSGNMSLSGAQKLYFGNGDIATASFVPGGGSATGTGTISGPSSGNNFSTVTVNYLNDATVGSKLSGNLNLVIDTQQKAILTRANDYTGTTTVNNGSLTLTGDGLLGTGSVTIKSDAQKTINLALGENAIITANGQDATIVGHSMVNATSIQGASADSRATISHAAISVADGKSLQLSNVRLVDTAFSGQVDLAAGVSAESLTIQAASTFKLAGGDNILQVDGTLTLQTGSTLDLARLFETSVQNAPLRSFSNSSPQLMSSGTGDTAGLAVGSAPSQAPALLGASAPAAGDTFVLASAQNIDLQRGVNLSNLADGFTGKLSSEAADSGYNLVLTLAEISDLIWDGGSKTWDVNTTASWHTEADPGTPVVFLQKDNVTFGSGTATATLGDNITAGNMTLGSGAVITMATGTYNLTVEGIVSGEGELTKTGNGKLTFSSSEAATLRKLVVNGGSAEFDGCVTITGGSRVDIQSGKAEFMDGLVNTSGTDHALVVGNGSGYEAILHGTSNFGTKAIGIGKAGKLTIAKDATVTAGAVENSSNFDNNGALILEDGAVLTQSGVFKTTSLTLGEGSAVNMNGGRVTYQIKDITGAGNINISSASGNRVYSLTGDISGWTGTLSQASGSGNMTLNISGTEALNANIVNNTTAANCYITVNLTHNMDVNGSINYISNGPVIVNVGDANTAVAATFTNSVKTSSLGIANAGSTATLAGGATVGAISGAGAIVVGGADKTVTISGNGGTAYTGTITVQEGANLVFNASTNFGGKLAQAEGGAITLYGTAGQLANEDARISVTKKDSERLTLAVGSNLAISKVTVGTGSTTYVLVDNIAENEQGLYTDIDFTATGTKDNGIVVTTPSATSHIGSLSSESANTQVRGDYGSQNARVLAVHQDGDTIFAGTFVDNGNRCVGLDKYGTGTLTLTGANASNQALTVNGGAVAFSGSGTWTGAITVNDDGRLELLSTTATSFAGALTVNGDGTLKLSGSGDTAATFGSLTLASGSILDLRSLGITGAESDAITLVNGGTIDSTNLGSVQVLLDSSVTRRHALQVQDNSLVLTFVPLVWDGASGNGLWDSGDNWHAAATPDAHVAFNAGDDVQFSSGFTNTVALNGDVNANIMTIDNGVTVSVDTAGHNLSIHDLDSAGGSLTKTGTGTATFGGSDAAGVTLAALSVTGGSVEFNELVTVTGGTSITPTNSSSVTFHNGLAFTGQGGKFGYALIIGNGITGTLGGTTSMSAKLIGVAAGGSLVLENNASVTVKGVYNTTSAVTSNGTIQIGDNATLTTSGAGVYSTGVTMGSGSTLTLGGNSEVSRVTGSGTVNVNGGNLTIASNGNTIGALNIASGKTVNLNGGGSSTTIATIGSLSGAGNISISSGNGNRTYNLTGDLSQWTGKLSQASGSGNMNLNISGTSALNGSIENTATGATCNITVNLTHDMAVNGSINYTSAGPVILNIGTSSQPIAATFTNTVKAGNLNVQGTSTATFAGVSGNLGTISLTGNNSASATTLRFSPNAETGASSYTATTINMSSSGNTGLKWVIVDAGATLELTGSSLGTDGRASILNSWGVRGGGLEVNGTLTTAGTISMDSGGNQSTIKGSGQINTAGLNISNSSTTTIQGGLKINITSDTGVYKRANSSTLYLADVTLQALEESWELKNNMGTVNLTNADTGTTFQADSGYTITVSKAMGGAGKLVKTGEGTLLLNSANTYSGATEVREGTLEVSTTGSLGTGSVSVAENANLKFAPTSADTTVAIALSGTGTLEHSGTGTTTYTGSTAAFHGSVDVEEGVLNIMNATNLNVKDVTIGAGATMGVYKNGTSTEENEGKVTIAYGYTLSAGNLARLNADLEMQHGSLLDVSKAQVGTTDINGLIMGSSVTIQGAVYEDGKLTSPGTYLVYTDDQGVQHNALEEVDGYLRDYFATSGNQYYVLFNDVEELYLNGSTEASGEIAFNGWDKPFTDANTLFSNVNQNTYAVVYTFNGTNVGTLAICLVPEPTTGTLSLLALCALAARRRRK